MLDWDFTSSLRMNFRATSTSIVDELRQVGIADAVEDRPWVDAEGSTINRATNAEYTAEDVNKYRNDNLKKLGRNKNYSHQVGLTYRLPISLLPMMDWISSTAEYKTDYSWTAGSLLKYDDGTTQGNIIQNKQIRNVNATFSFDKLYAKSNYLKGIEKGVQKSKTRAKTRDDKGTSKTPDTKDSKEGMKSEGKKGGDKNAEEDVADNKREQKDQKEQKDEKDQKDNKGQNETKGLEQKNGKDAAAIGGKDANDKDSQDKDSEAKDTKEKEKKSSGPSTVERILIRPLLAIRSIKFTYKEEQGTIIPGFRPETELLGLSDGFNAPGWGFVAGLQPDLERRASNDNFLFRNQDWFNKSTFFNDQIAQGKRHNITAKVLLEPFTDFDIDIDFSKDYREEHTEIFKYKNESFMQISRNDAGSYEFSYIALGGLFGGSDDMFRKFKLNTIQVSHALATSQTAHPTDPYYKEGYGPLSNEVLVPAFFATYTGVYHGDVKYDLTSQVKDYGFFPRPNWSIRYDGLSKMPFFKDILSNFTLKHGYKGSVTINRFNSDISYNENSPNILKPNGDYYSRLLIPTMTINQTFNPIIGINFKTKSEMTFNFEYKKSRRVELNQTSLADNASTEIVLGYSYKIKDFKGFGKQGKQRKKKVDPTKEEEQDQRKTKVKTLFDSKGRSLTINFDGSFREDFTLNYYLDREEKGQDSRQQKVITISPNVEYQMYKNLAIRFFADYQNTQSKIQNSPSIINFTTGGTVIFTFN